MAKTAPKYVPADSKEINEKFINYVMERGKKSRARAIFRDALEIIRQKQDKKGVEPQDVFEKALANISPVLEVQPKRVGGAVYQVPVEVTPRRRQALAMRWLLNAAKGKSGKPVAERLAGEIMEAADGAGVAVKRKEDVHRMAEANRAFAHFAKY